MLIKQAFIHGQRDLRLDFVTLEDENLGANEIIVRTEVTALSTGTDIGNYLGDSKYIPRCPGYPRPVGYSNVGRIVGIGSAVHDFRVGQRVFATKRHASAYRAQTSDLVLPIGDSVDSDDASLAYLAQLSLSALRQARYQSGETVAIVGLGVIGLAGVGMARALGARTIAIGNSELRLAVAKKLGAHRTILDEGDSDYEGTQEQCSDNLPDIVILAADSWSAYRTAMRCVRYNGRVAILGFPGRWEGPPPFNPLDPAWIWAKHLSVLGSGFDHHHDCEPWERRFTTRRNLKCILDLMEDGTLSLSPVITHRVPAASVKDIYELAAARSKELITAVFDWRDL